MKYYHGTTTTFLPGIKKYGLLPPQKTGNICENRTGNRDFVFLTDSISAAFMYARRACEKYGGEPRVLEIIGDAVPERRGRINQYRLITFRKIKKVLEPEDDLDLDEIRAYIQEICDR